MKRQLVTGFQKYVLNPVTKPFAGYVGPSLLETTGRKSGKPRRTPVGAKFKGGSYWIVAEQGKHANYVRNIEANKRVRIRHKRKWHDGKAHVLHNENPRPHTHGLNGLMVRLVGTELLVIRIDPSERR
jgi:deazaflavin-dependent oxidoreductase (nitroreductase family)